MSDVVFVQMPFAGVERPSLALGLFTASLRQAGLSTESVYANIGFAEKIGLPAYVLVRTAPPSSLLGEWVFADSAFGGAPPGMDGVASSSGAPHGPARPRPPALDAQPRFDVEDEFVDIVVRYRGQDSVGALLLDLRAQAAEFVDELAAQIVAMGARVVACTSMFDQHVGSLALLQRVKQRNPAVLTVMGGANCAGPMGRATHHAFPWVDFTVTGEFDQFATAFFASLLAADGDAGRVVSLPPNVLGPGDRGEERRHAPLPPAAILADMDSAAIPDYDDFFEQLYSSPIAPYVLASIPLETSRGCWWGAKQHCTFCGLNAEGMAFRKKSPARALHEIRTLTSKYAIHRFSATDNIIDMGYFQTVLPQLAADSKKYSFFYETKANLKPEHVQVMAEAGCDFIQPGIESLHDETLRIMKKGTTACSNIQLLKYCVEYGVTPAWSILCGFPGSDPEWVAEIAADLPALFHLPPPNGTTPIRFDRFSPYHQQPGAYGLTLEPLPAYERIYGLAAEDIDDLAYFFRRVGGLPPDIVASARASGEVTRRWRAQFWSRDRAELVFESDDDVIRIRDTRPCSAATSHEVRGLEAAVLRLVESPATREGLKRRLEAGGGAPSDADVDEALADLVGRRLVWRSSSQLVALPTVRPRRPMRETADAAVGKVDMGKYILEKDRFRRAFA